MVHFPNAAASFCRCWPCGQSASSGDRNNYALNGVLRVRAAAATTAITTTTIYKCSIIVAVAVVVVVVAIAIAVVVVAAVAVVAIVYHAQFARATIAEEMTT